MTINLQITDKKLNLIQIFQQQKIKCIRKMNFSALRVFIDQNCNFHTFVDILFISSIFQIILFVFYAIKNEKKVCFERS